MLDVTFKVIQIGKPENVRYYADDQNLSEDFPLDNEEITALYEGRDIKKRWAKREWLITLLEPEE